MPDGANKGSFVQAYKAQAAVDSQAHVIVAAELTQQTNDSQQPIALIQQVAGVDLRIATGRQKHGEKAAAAIGPLTEDASPKEAMAHKLRTEAGKSIYERRKALVKPVFGQTKDGGDSFSSCTRLAELESRTRLLRGRQARTV